MTSSGDDRNEWQPVSTKFARLPNGWLIPAAWSWSMSVPVEQAYATAADARIQAAFVRDAAEAASGERAAIPLTERLLRASLARSGTMRR